MSPKEPAQDIDNKDLDFSKQDKITFGTRAPHSKDQGMFWVKYTASSDTTISLYIRHPKSGTWRKADFT